MASSDQHTSISDLKAKAAAILKDLAASRRRTTGSHHGEDAAIPRLVSSYEKAQETLALLRILELSLREAEEGQLKPLAAVCRQLNGKAGV